jgi:long-chain acyl-CoA synthetase
VGDHLFSLAQWLVAGFTINCPESGSTVPSTCANRPHLLLRAAARVRRHADLGLHPHGRCAAKLKQWLYANSWSWPSAWAPTSWTASPWRLDRLKYSWALLIYGPLRNVLGLSRIRVAYTAGAAIGPDLFRFFRSIGINLKQLYGQTETCAYVCLQPTGQVKLDTVGQAAPGIELKIADNGEVLVKGVSVLKEYYKRPDATAEVIDADGYFHTGDAGVIDADGHLRIIDRAKDVGKINRGAMFAPNYIENKLKFFPHQGSRVLRQPATRSAPSSTSTTRPWATGPSARACPTAAMWTWPPSQGAGADGDCIEQGQCRPGQRTRHGRHQIGALPGAAQGAGPDDDELTRTRKVRRNFIAEKYGVLVDALYGGKQEQFIETLVKFEDGRTGSVSATLQILDAKTFPAAAAA